MAKAFPSTPTDGQVHNGYIYDAANDLWHDGSGARIRLMLDEDIGYTDYPQAIAINSSAKGVLADKADSSRIAVTGITSESLSSGEVVTAYKTGLFYDENLALTQGEPCFLGDSGEVIQDTELIVNEEYRVFLGYAVDENTIDLNIGEPLQVGVSAQYWDSAPLGSIMFASSTHTPEGWMRANGQELDRDTYAELNQLYKEDDYPHGDGDGSTTFNIPDYDDETAIVKVRYVDSRSIAEQGYIEEIAHVPRTDEFPETDTLPVGKEVWRTDLDAFFKWNGDEWIQIS